MRKLRNTVFVISALLLVSLIGCSRYLNKPWPDDHFKLKIDSVKGGEHEIDYGIVVLRYEYSFNQDQTLIILDGEVEYRDGIKLENVLLHNFEVNFFFIDSENIVMKMENKKLYKATMEQYSYPFKLTLPFNDQYDSLSCFVESYTVH